MKSPILNGASNDEESAEMVGQGVVSRVKRIRNRAVSTSSILATSAETRITTLARTHAKLWASWAWKFSPTGCGSITSRPEARGFRGSRGCPDVTLAFYARELGRAPGGPGDNTSIPTRVECEPSKGRPMPNPCSPATGDVGSDIKSAHSERFCAVSVQDDSPPSR